MVDLYCASYATPPAAVTLDIDDTVDVVHGSLLWGSVTELVLHAVPCLAIENCLVLPGVAGALVRDLADVDRIR
jgi:hypothetical protein